MDDWFDSESSELPEDLAARVKPELEPGERLIWAARSRPRAEVGQGAFRGAVLVFLASAIAGVLAFAAFGGIFGDRFRPAEGLLAIVGILATLVALGSFFTALGSALGRVANGRNSARPVYALTDRRAIIWRPVESTGGVEIHSIPAGVVEAVHRVEYPDGLGDVVLRGVKEGHARGYPPPGFEGVAEVRRVEALVRAALITGE